MGVPCSILGVSLTESGEFLQGGDTFGDGGVGVVEDDAESVGGEVGEVVGGEFLEGGDEVGGGALDFGGVGVGFEFVFAGPGVHGDSEEEADRLEEEHEEDKSVVWVGPLEGDAEGWVELFGEGVVRVDDEADKEEDDAHLDHGEDHALDDVLALEVADFVGENGDEFLGGLLFDEVVVEGDLFAFAEAGEEGVGFCGAAGAVHDGNFGEREFATLGHFVDGVLEFAVGHRFELVEEGEDETGGEVGEEEGKDGDATPGPEPGVVDVVKDPEDAGDEGDPDEGGEDEGFDLVGDEGALGGLVEAEAFLENEGVVDFEGEVEEVVSDIEDADVDEADNEDGATEGPAVCIDPAEAAHPPEDEEEGEGPGGGDEVVAGRGAGVVLGFCVFFGVEGVAEFCGEFRTEGLQVEQGGDEVQVPEEEEDDQQCDSEGIDFRRHVDLR